MKPNNKQSFAGWVLFRKDSPQFILGIFRTEQAANWGREALSAFPKKCGIAKRIITLRWGPLRPDNIAVQK